MSKSKVSKFQVIDYYYLKYFVPIFIFLGTGTAIAIVAYSFDHGRDFDVGYRLGELSAIADFNARSGVFKGVNCK